MNFSQDHFALFGLPRAYALDTARLEQHYRELQNRVHPDKHAHLSDAERRLAMQWSTQVNEAYRSLRHPLWRAQYLLHLAGIDVQMEHNTAMSTEFLMQQMEWREAVEEARSGNDMEALEHLHRRIKQEMAEQYRLLESQMDTQREHQAAAGTVRQLMFQEKLLQEIDGALATLET